MSIRRKPLRSGPHLLQDAVKLSRLIGLALIDELGGDFLNTKNVKTYLS